MLCKQSVCLHFELSATVVNMIIDIYYIAFLTPFWFSMLVNEYRLEIQFKKVWKV
jgi:hypothetical protein